MNKWKFLAIVFTVLTLGAFRESLRIFTSEEPDIASSRKELIIIAVILTSLFVYLSIRFWRKASDNRIY